MIFSKEKEYFGFLTVNKMCQIYFQNEDKEKLFNDFVKNKVKHQINSTRKEFQNEIK